MVVKKFDETRTGKGIAKGLGQWAWFLLDRAVSQPLFVGFGASLQLCFGRLTPIRCKVLRCAFGILVVHDRFSLEIAIS